MRSRRRSATVHVERLFALAIRVLRLESFSYAAVFLRTEGRTLRTLRHRGTGCRRADVVALAVLIVLVALLDRALDIVLSRGGDRGIEVPRHIRGVLVVLEHLVGMATGVPAVHLHVEGVGNPRGLLLKR